MTKYNHQWRLELLARMGAERFYLIRQLWGLDEETLSSSHVEEDWTAKDLLAHVAYWDGYAAGRMSHVINGRIADIHQFTDDDEIAEYNANLFNQFKENSLEGTMAMVLKERSGFYATLDRVTDQELHKQLTMPWGQRLRMRTWARRRFLHDSEHGSNLAKWRHNLSKEITSKRTGPKHILRAILQTSRKEFQLTANLVPESERTTMQVCGVWTLKDLLGHITDWEKVGIEGLQQLVDQQTPTFDYEIGDFDVFNNGNAAARQDQSWDEVWEDYVTTRKKLMELFDALPEEGVGYPFTAPWQRPTNVYFWMSIWLGHEHEHTHDIRQAVGLKLPKRLQH